MAKAAQRPRKTAGRAPKREARPPQEKSDVSLPIRVSNGFGNLPIGVTPVGVLVNEHGISVRVAEFLDKHLTQRRAMRPKIKADEQEVLGREVKTALDAAQYIYSDPSNNPDLRLRAAATALPYEQPKKISLEGGDPSRPISVLTGDLGRFSDRQIADMTQAFIDEANAVIKAAQASAKKSLQKN